MDFAKGRVMSKITTADCKKFLVAEVTKNPDIIHDVFGDRSTAIKEAQIEKKWCRETKFDPCGTSDYAQDYYSIWAPRSGISRGAIANKDLAAVRIFCLDSDQFDSAVMFMVLEDKKGQLHLGEYVGD